MGSQDVSYHAGQRAFRMLHVYPQTVVKEEFPNNVMAIKPKMIQNFPFFPSNSKFQGDFGQL